MFSNEVVLETIEEVDDLDKSLYRQLVYGVIENLIYIDYMIDKLSNIKINKLDKKVLNILRIGIYELNFLNTKQYAVINEAVKNTKKVNFRSKGFVNAILRSFLRNKDEITNIDIKDKDEYLSIKYSCDISIIKYIKKYYDDYEEIIKSFNDTPKMSIRVNTFLIDKNELIERLKNKGFKVRQSNISKDCLFIENPKEITEIDEFVNGLFTIQDQSSILVGEILNPKNESLVLDLCAAPGSKSTHLLQIMNNEGLVVSNDISKDKLDKIKENFNRLKLKNYEITNYDATKYNQKFSNKFDYVLVDAPCSGLGVISRKPEIKLNKDINDIKSLSDIQYKILENSYKYLKNNSYLVYSTCTLGDIENKNIIDKFLCKHNDLKLEKINNKNYLEIKPSKDNDGFFIAKMLKQ